MSRDVVFGVITKWQDYSLYWSPDGNRLHFTRDFIPYAEKGGLRDAYLINISSGEVKYIGSQGRHILDWADGRIIYTEEGYSYIYDISSKKESKGLEEFYRYHAVSYSDYLDRYGENVLFLANGILFIYDVKTSKYKILAKDLPYGSRGAFSPDGKKIVYGHKGNLWTIDTDGKNKKQIASNLFNNKLRVYVLLWKLDGKKVLIKPEGRSIWRINSDGSNLEKLADNASYPELTSIPRITFISPNVVKIIILIALALTGLLLVFGIVLITKKAVKAIAVKPRSAAESKVSARGDFCANCGTQNPESASFCKKCGQRLKE